MVAFSRKLLTKVNSLRPSDIGSDNGFSPGRRQVIIWDNAGILLIGPLWTNFNVFFIEIHKFAFEKILFKMSCGKWRPSCLGLNVLKQVIIDNWCHCYGIRK